MEMGASLEKSDILEESHEETQLHSLLQQHSLSRSVRDTVRWGQNDKFSVKSLYTKAVTQMENDGSVDRLICSVWQKLAPPKVELMVWLALLGKLNTRDRLVKEKMIPAELNYCTFCNSHNEGIDHVLLSCPVFWSIWKSIAEELGVQLANEDNLRNFYTYWINRRFSNKTRWKLWVTSFFSTLWSLWMQRNGIIFKQQMLDMQSLCRIIKWRVATWSRAWEVKIPYSAELLVQNFQAIPMLFH